MKPPAFEYVLAGSVDEAVAALASTEDARPLAGGQSLVPLMNLRLARPPLLVDINGLTDLDHVTVNGDVRLGAMCRHRRLERDPEIRAAAPLVAHAAALIGHPQIRNRGTLGGSLSHGDPAAELGAVLLTLEGRVRVVGPSGAREIPSHELFTGFFSTSIAPDELLIEVVVPLRPDGGGSAVVEYAPRHGDFAVVGVAAQLRRENGRCLEARAAACGVGETAVDLSEALTPLLDGDPESADVQREVAARTTVLVRPLDDVHASADDRKELTQLLTVEAVRRAWADAGQGADG
jgi:aerobic carbon-monoxide dehydrogenase medium subunit